jgi:serine/threonine protein kinase
MDDPWDNPPDEEDIQPVGTILAGRYQVVSLIGRGGQAAVYRCVDHRLDREVALKVLSKHLTSFPAVVKRFQREAQVMASLDSRYLVPIYDVGRDGGHFFLVMKLLKGRTLGELLETSGAFTQERAIHVVAQVLEGLAHLHARSLVHRDIKPGNIILDEHERAVLLDLGITRDLTGRGLTTDGTTLGTPAYMSPEQAKGLNLDGRSDLYSVGILLFELLTTRLPFDAPTAIEIAMKQISEPPPSPRRFVSSLSENLTHVILRALEKPPERRYPTAAKMREALLGAALEPAVEDSPSPQHGKERLPFPAEEASDEVRETSAEVSADLEPGMEPRRFEPRFVRWLAFIALVVVTVGGVSGLLLFRMSSQAPTIRSTPSPLDRRAVPDPDSGTEPPPVDSGPPGYLSGVFEPDDDVPPNDGGTLDQPRLPTADLPDAVPGLGPGESARDAGPKNRSGTLRRPSPPVVQPQGGNPGLSPDDPVAQARERLSRRDTAGAIRVLESAAARTPNRAEVYRSLGDAHSRVGNRTAAIAAYRRYLALRPEAHDAEQVRRRLRGLGER